MLNSISKLIPTIKKMQTNQLTHNFYQQTNYLFVKLLTVASN